MEAIKDFNRNRVLDVKNQIDDLLDNLPKKIDWVISEQENMLKHQYKPKLVLAKNKV